MQKPPEFNILIVGETGVGKSTFINGIANYLTYETLEEAEQNEVVSLIPTKFNVTDENLEIRKVFCGKDENEDTEDGESATQTCKCYVFYHENRLIRIIDTPGIGDVRGIEQDKKNMENLMIFIGQYTHLHAICILMKPNNARMTVEFQFCLKQLLCQLAKSASQNLIFVFTNARSTFYKPGESLPLLKKVLTNIEKNPPHVKIEINKNTVFCLDNEAFRFLLAMRNGIRFTGEQKRDFSASWRHSFEESMRLINRIIGDESQPGLAPHKIKETLSVNEARQAIINLSQPLADITQNIQDNLKILEERKKEVMDNSDNIEKLKNKLYIPQLDLVITQLPHPATVCADKTCAKPYKVSGISKWHYTQRCHPHCYLENVPSELLGDSSLKYCAAMKKDKCKQCKHSYKFHMHVYYDSHVIEAKIEDDNIKRQIDAKVNAQTISQMFIISLEAQQKAYQREQNTISKAMAKFGHFLKTNAIAPYNDSFKEYLLQQISIEESLSAKGFDNREKLFGLGVMLKQYDEEVRILDQAFNMKVNFASKPIVSDEIFDIIEELFNLELSGEKIIKSYQTFKEARKRENLKQREMVYKPSKLIKSVTEGIANTVKGMNDFFSGTSKNKREHFLKENNHKHQEIDESKIENMIDEILKKKGLKQKQMQHDNKLLKSADENNRDDEMNRNRHPKPAERTFKRNVTFDDTVDRQNRDQIASAPVEEVNRQAGVNNAYPQLPSKQQFDQPMGQYPANPYPYWNNQMPPFPMPQQYPFLMPTPPAMPFQDINAFQPPPYDYGSEKKDEINQTKAKEIENQENGKKQDEENVEDENEIDILKKRLDNAEKRIEKMENVLKLRN